MDVAHRDLCRIRSSRLESTGIKMSDEDHERSGNLGTWLSSKPTIVTASEM